MLETENNNSNSSETTFEKQTDERSLLRWRKRNSYYYKWLDKIYKFAVRPNSRVLHVGCDCGDLLAAVKPSYGVGVDPNPNAV